MKIWPKHINQSGDTIIEVIIAVAIISSVLVGAFLVSQKSTLAVRDSQEHGEMLQILQGQVDLVSAMAQAEKSPTAGIFATAPKYFCIDGSKPAHLTRVDFPSSFVLPAADADPYEYPSACKDVDSRYNVAISYDATTHVFSFSGRWDRIGGEKNEAKMSYRAYAGQEPVAVAPPVAPLPLGGGGGGGIGGPAIIGSCVGICALPAPPRPPDYHYYGQFQNTTTAIPAAQITGCKWDFGDGSVLLNTSCQFGETVEHRFDKVLGRFPYPKDCPGHPGAIRTNYTVTFYVVLPGGSLSKQATQSITMPSCW